MLSSAIMAFVWATVVISLFSQLSELRAEVEALRILYEVNTNHVRSIGLPPEDESR